jgi:hypothetical protein
MWTAYGGQPAVDEREPGAWSWNFCNKPLSPPRSRNQCAERRLGDPINDFLNCQGKKEERRMAWRSGNERDSASAGNSSPVHFFDWKPPSMVRRPFCRSRGKGFRLIDGHRNISGKG